MRWLILALGLIAGSVMPGWANPEDASVRVEEVLRLLAEGFEEHLTALGYDAGPSDGVLDSQTEAAVRAFEADHGLPITGEMSGEIQSVVYQRARDDPTAAAHLCGSLYENSKSALAWQWCGILAQQGDVKTIVSVASTLWRISAYMQDDPYIFIDVWRLYESAAEKNDPDSQYWLADRYRSNDDWIEAARWARMAAEQGHE